MSDTWDLDEATRTTLQAGAVVVGLLASSVHWGGLLLGGALVGFLASSVRRGLLGGAGFALLAWALFVGRQVLGGVGPYTDAGLLLAVSAAIALVLGTVGGSVRAFR
ncbi:MAG: hypothetical protein ABEJ67_01350 [Halanaeroarchaeum sp.]